MSSATINHVEDTLREMNILKSNSTDESTNYGMRLSKLPDFGSLAMARSVLAAFDQYDCGYDLICLSSILSVMNISKKFKKIPIQFQRPAEGDLMTLLNVFQHILTVKQSVPNHKFSLHRLCQDRGLLSFKHILRQALRRLQTLEQQFAGLPQYYSKALVKSCNWPSIAKSLLVGYSDHVFISMADLQKRLHHYERYNSATNHIPAILNFGSILYRKKKETPVKIILARDIVFMPLSIREKTSISFLGELRADWLEYDIQREIQLNDAERKLIDSRNSYVTARTLFGNRITMNLTNNFLKLEGPAGYVFKAEVFFLQQIITDQTYKLQVASGDTINECYSRNLESLTKMPNIFNPMLERWKIEKQIELTVSNNFVAKTCQITIKGRPFQTEKVVKELGAFNSWLKRCAIIRHPNSGVTPRLLRAQMRRYYTDMEKRISRITDPNRSKIDLHNNVHSKDATRETRMEVVAWIAVCLFDCTVEGGFVRDWIVSNQIFKPTGLQPNDWIEFPGNPKSKKLPSINPAVVPRDLDCQLSLHSKFKIDDFLDELHKFGIQAEPFVDDWRYVVLVDKDTQTGPFTMDIIQAHVALTHDRIDLDVNNLVLEKNYTRDLGMRVDIDQKQYSITLETIIENIRQRQFRVLREIDEYLKPRIDKMIHIRHWKQIGDVISIIPNPQPNYNAVLVMLNDSSIIYKKIQAEMRIISDSIDIVSMEEIKNPFLEEMYEGMKKLIATECLQNNPNERLLFHGTKGNAIEEIPKFVFDDRFYRTNGYWGAGAYFADDPRRSDTFVDSGVGQKCIMFYNKVTLGKQYISNQEENSWVAAPHGYHSVYGACRDYPEYIVYRYGQALPYIKVIYRVYSRK